MEDLIAAFPEEFFPRQGLVLKGRQESFEGVGRFDLLFTDRYKRNVLMELKAVVAKWDNANQLAKYKDALEARGEANILMWLVAPNIPKPIRDFFDMQGIEYSEIHEVEFRNIAARNERVIETPPKPPLEPREPAPREDRKEPLRSAFAPSFEFKVNHSFKDYENHPITVKKAARDALQSQGIDRGDLTVLYGNSPQLKGRIRSGTTGGNGYSQIQMWGPNQHPLFALPRDAILEVRIEGPRDAMRVHLARR
ncbi:MAG: endonuclease NucS domain-containing protein [Bryobacteraceae bacterium]